MLRVRPIFFNGVGSYFRGFKAFSSYVSVVVVASYTFSGTVCKEIPFM